MQGVENASALVEEEARTANTKWLEHLDASGLHLNVPYELLCCGVRDVGEIVDSVFDPSVGDVRYGFCSQAVFFFILCCVHRASAVPHFPYSSCEVALVLLRAIMCLES